MLRTLRLALAGVTVATVTGLVAVAAGQAGGAATNRAVVAHPATVNAAADLPTIPTTSAPDTTTTAPPTTTTVAPTTLPPTTAAPAPPPTTAAPRVVRPAPVTFAPPVTVAPPVTPPVRVATSSGGGNAADYSLEGYRWNPCSVITVATTGPDIAGIVAELASITGLHLQIVSGVGEINVMYGAVPPGGEIGLTAWKAVGRFLTTAGIIISPQAQPYLTTVLRHELGHALGLGHAGHADEVMYPTVGRGSPTDYQAGDLAGLRAIGASAGC